MNILFLINYAGNAGTENYVDLLVDRYQSKGHQCFLAYNIAGQLSEKMESKGVKSLQLDLGAGGMISSPKKLAAFCSENQIDVIHAQYPRENIIAIKSLNYYSLPKVVFTSHLSIRQGLKWKILNRIYTGRNHAVIALFDDAKEILKDNGVAEDKIQIIYNGVAEDSRRASYSLDPFRISIMARYSEEKGLDFLLDSIADLKRKTDKKIHLDILGEGELFDHIKDRISELGLGDDVTQVGFTTETKKYLLNSSLYVCSSLKNEAMSFAILEAFSVGLPCVATNVGGNAKLINEYGVSGSIVNSFEPSDFADAIKKYIDDEKLWAEHSDAAAKKIKNVYSIDTLAEKTLRVYE